MSFNLVNPYLDPNLAKRLEGLPMEKQRELSGNWGILTPIQELTLPAIEWLIGGPIGSGKTEILCHAFIRQAIRTGDWVRPFDHDAPWEYAAHCRVNFPQRIRHIVELYYPEWVMTWRVSTNSFKLEREKK